MIKATELRIGNFIMENGQAIKVKSLSDWSSEEINDTGIHYDLFSPISLDTTWLMKLGYCTEISNQGTNVESVPFYSNDSYLALDWNTLEPIWQGIELDIKLQYVHQLQNLYFILTGEELEIK
jgi:hypothetical protein